MKKGLFGKIKVTAFFLCIMLCSSLFSCGREYAELSVFNSTFTARISYAEGEEKIYAFVTIWESVQNGERDIQMKITSPDCLSGMEFTRIGGESELYFEKISLSEAACKRYIQICEMLIPKDSFKYLSQASCEEDILICYLQGNDKWYFSKLRGALVKIEGEKGSIDVISIEPK